MISWAEVTAGRETETQVCDKRVVGTCYQVSIARLLMGFKCYLSGLGP